MLDNFSTVWTEIWYENNKTTAFVTQKAVIREIWADSWGMKKKENCREEIPSIINCLLPSRAEAENQIPSWVSFVNENCAGDQTFVKIVAPIRVPKKKNFVICVKPLHFANIEKTTLKEWLEINERLGAQKILVYLSNSTATASVSSPILKEKVFEAPQLKCPLSSFEESIWRKRKLEIIAYNDCLYSNLYTSHFIIPLDVDEIIVPKIGNNWLEAFSSHFFYLTTAEDSKNYWPENYSSFSVRNAYFFLKYPRKAVMLPKPRQNLNEKLVNFVLKKREFFPTSSSIFDRNIRSYRLSPSTDSVKSFVYVPKTLSVFNHFTFHVLGDAIRQYVFPQNIFQLNHYRNSCDTILIDGCQYFLERIVYDDSLEKFRNRNL